MSNCARCFKPEPAITRVHFTYEDTGYYLDLCAEHEQRFESDMLGWVRLAETERPHLAVVTPPATPDSWAMARATSRADLAPMSPALLRVPFPVTNGGVEEHDSYPERCPPSERAKWADPNAPRYDEAAGDEYVSRVLMQPRK